MQGDQVSEKLLNNQQSRQGWGSAVLDGLASELKSVRPEVKGFSHRTLFLMTQFYREYPDAFVQPAVAQTDHPSKLLTASSPSEKVQQVVAQIPWAHNVLLLQRVKNPPDRLWYMRGERT